MRTTTWAAKGLPAQDGGEVGQRSEVRDVRGGLVVTQWAAFFITSMLCEHAAQIDLAGFGGAVGLLAFATEQFALAHRHPRAVGADIHHRQGGRVGGDLSVLLPAVSRWSYPLDHALNLPHID